MMVYCVMCIGDGDVEVHIFSTQAKADAFATAHEHEHDHGHILYDYLVDHPERSTERGN